MFSDHKVIKSTIIAGKCYDVKYFVSNCKSLFMSRVVRFYGKLYIFKTDLCKKKKTFQKSYKSTVCRQTAKMHTRQRCCNFVAEYLGHKW